MTLYKIQRKYQKMSLFLFSWIIRKVKRMKSEKIRKHLLAISENGNIIASTSRNLRKRDDTCKNACEKGCLRKTEFNVGIAFLTIQEWRWNPGLRLP